MTEEKVWTEDLGEISGFGGGYEAVCRAMVMAGIKWVDEHPESDLSVSCVKGVFGLATAENEAAKNMEEAMMSAPVFYQGKKIQDRADSDCTGAMHHAAMNHVFAYKRLGWDEYRKQLRDRKS